MGPNGSNPAGRVTIAALVVLLIVGISLRVYFMTVWRPALLGFTDSTVYLKDAFVSTFWDPLRVVGYGLFLRWAHDLGGNLSTTILLQHALGVATGLLLYAAARRVGGPSFYAFGASPANLVYGGSAQFPPNDAAIRHVGAFARAAIRGQPLDYARTVARNAWRFLSPGSFTAHSGESQAQLIDQLFAPANYQLTAGLVKSVYGTPALLQRHGVAHLRTYERHTRFNAVILLILAALVVTGAIVARERARVGVALFGLNAAALAVTPALTLFYDARYAIPTYGPLVAAAAFGAWGAYERATKRDGAGAPAQPAGAGE
jgi:hypothetical protein